MLNNIGDKTDCCGTPQVRAHSDNLSSPTISHWDCSWKTLENQIKAIRLRPRKARQLTRTNDLLQYCQSKMKKIINTTRKIMPGILLSYPKS